MCELKLDTQICCVMVGEDYSSMSIIPHNFENSILVCGLVVGAIYMERLKSIRPGGAVDDKKLCKKKGM